ncbi:H-NS family nucleoid-associated regulatory protein [Photobacterium ganghwense]|uniref:H-NS family histone-like protein n=1 Tax=Photobacterium ganghwense TaxID=320778 RepID=UPI001A8F93D7|nr:H-NS family nucleoid-associated regulatory protein [Photobacterium ganghwense]QSV17135.1 H-NS histone family protein [Photobacterium ganghwense]
MRNIIKLLTNIRSLRAFAREYMTLEQLKDALEKLTQVVKEREAEEEQLKAENKERAEKLEVYRQMLLDDGIKPEELLSKSIPSTKKKTRQENQEKYRFTNEKGEVKTWTGFGRMPNALRKALDEGAKLRDYRI